MPSITYKNKDGRTIHSHLSTYREVKQKMITFMDDSLDNCVSVYRTRRGEWENGLSTGKESKTKKK